jgi:SAM-dependent methyltransferase
MQGNAMGVDYWVFRTLAENRKRIQGKTLMYGRQQLHLMGSPYNQDDHVKQVLAAEGLESPGLEILSGYAEPLLQWLGAGTVQSLDYSAFEGADYVHDLNELPPRELEGQFDVIIDGGTLEHVFHFPNAIQNIRRMLKKGGTIFSFLPANNWLGHGFYQFSPELMWRVFNSDGFKVHSMRLTHNNGEFWDQTDPNDKKSRQEIGFTTGPNYVITVAEKIAESSNSNSILQSDYVEVWSRDQ